MSIDKKSTISVQSSWNSVKMIASLANHFHQVLLGLDKNYWFCTNGQFLNVSWYFLLRPYVFADIKSSFTIPSIHHNKANVDQVIWYWNILWHNLQLAYLTAASLVNQLVLLGHAWASGENLKCSLWFVLTSQEQL